MSKGKNKKAAASSPTPAKPNGLLSPTHLLLGALFGLLVQLLLGYFGIGVGSYLFQQNSSRVPPLPLDPPPCPAAWPNCPRSVDLHWDDVLELQSSAATTPSRASLAACDAPSLLSPQKVPGMHLLCVLPPPEGEHRRAAATLAAFPDMLRTAKQPSAIIVPPQLRTVAQLISTVYHSLKLTHKGGKYQLPALFNDEGIRIQSVQGALKQRRLLLMEGGQWIWPPVDVGHVHSLPGLIPGQVTKVVTVSLKPLVVSVENFLSPGENEHIIRRAMPHMAKSGVALKDADKGKAAKEFRTSSQYFLPTVGDALLEAVDRRVMMLTRIPISHAEYIQVLKYEYKEHYSAHHDFFDPKAYANNPEMIASIENGAMNRLATVFFYLNNVTAGGQTNFPRTAEYPNGGPQPWDYFDCSKGLSVFPQEGKVIIFYSMLPNGEMDDFSLHGGCDVLAEGEAKWSANFWLWNKPYHFISKARKRATDELEAQYL
ncbi:hypothetical protein AB1Y20_011235 [Prymnesium parvum]|uniref:Fe2OG dioxygenase domain-containing protein n=1 Tax=Prymnesium parvum TaxID=97485 RepID=A0AB34IP17_PRYPA